VPLPIDGKEGVGDALENDLDAPLLSLNFSRDQPQLELINNQLGEIAKGRSCYRTELMVWHAVDEAESA
jgi:hypothetical protein